MLGNVLKTENCADHKSRANIVYCINRELGLEQRLAENEANNVVPLASKSPLSKFRGEVHKEFINCLSLFSTAFSG